MLPFQIARALLLQDSAVSALVPAGAIGPVPLPAGAVPGLGLLLLDASRDGLVDDQPAGELWQAQLQITCTAGTFEAALHLAQAVERALDRRNGAVLGVPAVHLVSLVLGRYGPHGFDTDRSAWEQPVDFSLTYQPL
jgi:hypothetical protein